MLFDSRSFPYKYDAHGLVGIWSNIELTQFPRAFRKGVSDPDVIVSYSDRVPQRPGSFRYSYSPLKYLNTTVSITDSEGPIVLEISDDLRRVTGALRQALSNLISSAFHAKLLSSGYLLLHGAVLETNGKGVLLAAPAETGKTAATISLVKNHGYKFVSDDMSIIKGTDCYSFPIDLKIERIESIHGFEIESKKSLEYAWRSVLRSLPLFPQIFGGGIYVSAEKLFANRIIDETVIDTIVFLEHGPDVIDKIDGARALGKLISQHRIGIGSFDPFRNEIFLRYAYAARSLSLERLAKEEMELCEELVERTNCYTLAVRGYDFDKGVIRIMSGNSEYAKQP